jgi:hypothetical protein
MITAIVLYDLPPDIDREACRRHFLKIAPDFLDVPGFYSGKWLEGIRSRYGCEPRISYFETFAIADQGTRLAGAPMD